MRTIGICLATILISQSAFAWKSYDEKLKKHLEKIVGKQTDGKSKVVSNKHGCYYSVQPYAGSDNQRSCARLILNGSDPKLTSNLDHVKEYCDAITMADLACDYANDQYWWWMAAILDTGSMVVAQSREDIFAGQLKGKVDDLKGQTGSVTKMAEAKSDMCDGAGAVGALTQGAWQWYCAITKSNEMKRMRQAVADASSKNFSALKEIVNATPTTLPVLNSNPTVMGSVNGSMASGGSASLSESAIDFYKSIPDGSSSSISNSNAAMNGGAKDDGYSAAEKKFNQAAQKLRDAGVDPTAFMADADKGIANAIEKYFGQKIPSDVMAKMKELDKFEPTAAAPKALAYESSKSKAQPAAKKDKGVFDFFADRAPASAGELKSIDFGSANSTDIWHSGSPLSIFEIVTRKTTAVADRVSN